MDEVERYKLRDKLHNIEFQIVWCEDNLRWLAGDPPSEERTRRQEYMTSEIARLTTERDKLNADNASIAG
jgi:hypothetical protein